MGHVVKAPLVIVRTDSETLVHLYEGQPIPGNADPADVKRLAEEGFLTEVAAPEEDTTGRPAGNASLEAWAAYTVKSGKATEDAIKGLSRDELRELNS